MKTGKNYKRILLITLLITIIFSILALCLGQFSISLQDAKDILLGNGNANQQAKTVIFNIRLPRVILSIAAGAGLAVSGAAFQSLFANPLTTPDTLGTANGASFGAVLGILVGMNSFGVQLSSLAFGVIAVLIVYFVSKSSSKSSSMMMLILSGLVVSSLFSALVSLVKYTADPNDILPVITYWLMGSFSSITAQSLSLGLPLILAGIVVLYLLRHQMNVLSLSDDEAVSLGVNLEILRTLVVLAAAGITASVVSMCGVIGWTGLLIPHIARMVFGNNNSRVIPASIVFGGLFMLVTDTIARCLTLSEIPVSILTAVIGAPVFILLLRRTGGIHV